MGGLVGKVACTVGAGPSRVFPGRSLTIQSHGNGRKRIVLVFGAKRAVVAAMPTFKERDAVALYRILAIFSAVLNVRHISRRGLDVFLSGARVAFGAVNCFAPCNFRFCVLFFFQMKIL